MNGASLTALSIACLFAGSAFASAVVGQPAPARYLMDESGKVGMAYGAKVTPHMYVIDPAGRVVYNGAIDDKRSTDLADVKTAKNFVAAALEDLKAGRPVANASSAPYGCTVKYP